MRISFKVEPALKHYRKVCNAKGVEPLVARTLLDKYYGDRSDAGKVYFIINSIKELSKLNVDLTESNIEKQVKFYGLKSSPKKDERINTLELGYGFLMFG